MKLSASQLRALHDVASGNPYRSCRGRSQFGGRDGTLKSLRRLGLIGYVSGVAGVWKLTKAGEKLIQ